MAKAKGVKKGKKTEGKLSVTKSPTRGRVQAGTEDFKTRLWQIAFKPYHKTWEDLAKEIGISLQGLYDFRKNHAEEIEDIIRERYRGARQEIEDALINRAKGCIIERTIRPGGIEKLIYRDEPPDTKAVEYFFDRLLQVDGGSSELPVDIFANWYPQPKQVAPLLHWDRSFRRATPDEGQDQIIGVMAGRGFGKSDTLVHKALNLAKINRGCEGMILAPTYKMLANPIVTYWEAALAATRVPYKVHKQDGLYTLWGDTKVWFRSYDNVDTSGRGPTLAWLLCDEFREGSAYILQTLLASVREPKAKLRQTALFSTPNGYDHMYDLFGDPESKALKSGRAVLYNGATADNFVLPSGFIAMLEEAYDERIIKQEMLGQFVNTSQGQIYYNFDRNAHVGTYEIDWNLPLWIGVDFNFNPLCAVVGQPHFVNGRQEVHIVDEVRIEGASTQELCDELKRRHYDPAKIPESKLEIYPDASGVAASAATGSLSNIEILKNNGFTNLNHPRANCLVLDRYAAANGMLRNSKQDVRLIFDKRCRHTIADMEKDVFKDGANIRDNSTVESKKRGHLADALGYMIHRNFRIESAFTFAHQYP